ncbi:MAG: deoxynucleotide monophosphate kinase family protein [Lysobacteraceae bacterium]
MNIIGIAGAAGAGKDTLAQAVASQVEQGGGDVVILHLADPIKAGICRMFHLGPEVFNDRELKEKELPWLGASPRRLAQTLGTEWGRMTLGDDVWLRVLWREVEQCARVLGDDVTVLIPDVRFANEASWLRERGAVIVEVTRPNRQNVEAHVSEQGIAPELPDIRVVNVGFACHLKAAAPRVLNDAQAVREARLKHPAGARLGTVIETFNWEGDYP